MLGASSSSIVRLGDSLLVGFGQVLGYVAAIMAVHVVDLLGSDHRQ